VVERASAGRSTGSVLGVAMLCAGAAYPVTGAALALTTPAVVAAVRALVGGALLVALLPYLGGRLPRSVGGWTTAAVIGFGNVTLTLAGISEGTKLAGAAVASVLLNSAPFFAALMARAVLGERLTGLRVAGLVAGFTGIVAIVAGGRVQTGSHALEGVAVCLVGALGWAAAGLGMRYQSTRDPEFDTYGATAAQFVCGGLLLVPYLILAGGTTEWSSGRLWECLVFLVIGAQIVTYVGFNVALRHWKSARVFGWTFLAPVVAVAIEAVRGNLPGPVTTTGIAIVVVGVAIVNHPRSDADS
jgi:drug/metabolite transporter (DMT)-like permease